MTLSVMLSHFGRMTVTTIFGMLIPLLNLNSLNTPSVSEVSCSFGAVDTNSNGMQTS
jgi:hypothetical protein